MNRFAVTEPALRIRANRNRARLASVLIFGR